MLEVKDIKLTDDPLTNIHTMTPYLDEKGRAAVSGIMFGMVLKECMKEKCSIADGESNKKPPAV